MADTDDDDLFDNPPVQGRERDGAGGAPTRMTTFQQCRSCGTFVTSSKAFRLHVERCMLHSHTGNDSFGGERGPQFEDVGNRKRVVTFPVVKVTLRRLSPAEIEESAPGGTKTRQPRFHSRQSSNSSVASSSSSLPPAKVPRQSSLKARLKIRTAARQMIENTDKGDLHEDEDYEEDLERFSDQDGLDNSDPDQGDSDGADSPVKPKSDSRRHHRPPFQKELVPKFKNVKKGIHTIVQLRTSDELFSFHCPKCPAFFNSQAKLDKHVEGVHEDLSHQSDVQPCPICDKMIWKRLCFYGHIRDHTDAEAVEDAFKLWDQWPEPKSQMGGKEMRFACKHCLMPHTSHHSFLTHMKTRHPDKPRDFMWTCRYCAIEDFDTIYRFVGHMKDNHHKEFFGDPLRWHDLEHEPKQNCNICGKLLNIYHLKEHKLKQHPPKDETGAENEGKVRKYRCPLCPKRLKTVQLLKDHFISLHLKNNPFTCKFPGCIARYNNQYHLNRHMRIHTGEEMATCPKCGMSYSKKTLQSRTHICGGVDPSRVKILPDGKKLAHHSKIRLKRFHKSETEELQLQGFRKEKHPQQRVDINRIMRSDPVFIEACKQSPEFERLMATHMKGRPKRGTTFKCTKCSTFFNSRTGFAKHSSLCTGANDSSNIETEPGISMKFACPVCGAAFDTLEVRHRHLQDEHDPEEIFKCEDGECSEIFASAQTMKRHFSNIHAERPFPCLKCERKFTTEKTLAIHMDRHDESHQVRKVYACPNCGKVLSCMPSVRRHCLSAHGVTLPLGPPGGDAKKGSRKKKNKPASTPQSRRKRREQRLRRKQDKADKEIRDIQEGKDACRLVKVERELIIETDTDNRSESCHGIISNAEDIGIKKEASLIPVTKMEEPEDEDPYDKQ